MKVVKLESEVRAANGTSGARGTRRAGKVPAVIYGEGKSPETISLPAHEFRKAIDGGARVIDLQIGDGATMRVLLSEVQYDPLGLKVLHADFLRMDPEHALALHVPIEFEGAPKGLADGGVLTVLRDTLHVRCLPRDIPEKFTIDVSHLAVGDSLIAGVIPLPEGVKLAQPANDTIVTVAIPRIVTEEEPVAAEGAVPAEGEAVAGAPAAEGAEGAPKAAGKPGEKGAAAPAPKPAKKKGEK